MGDRKRYTPVFLSVRTLCELQQLPARQFLDARRQSIHASSRHFLWSSLGSLSLSPLARRAVRATAHGGLGESCVPGETMLRALALATTVLLLVRGFPILGRLLVLGELWPALLKHLTSALVGCATIFGMALSIILLAACYLYYKRRQLKPFFDVVLKGGESLHRSKSNDPNVCTPISLSQAFHFGQSQESSKNQTAMAADSKTLPKEQKRSFTLDSPCEIKRTTKSCSKEKPDVTIKELYASSDADRSSNGSQRSFTVRSKAYLLPSWSSESMGSLCDDDVCDTSSAQHSSSDEIIIEHGFSNQPRSNTNQKEKTPVSVACHSCKNQGQSTSSDEFLPIKKQRISKSKSESDIHISTNNQLRPIRSFTIFDGRCNT